MLAGCTISNFHHIRGGIKRGAKMPHCFKNDANTKNTCPQRLGAPVSASRYARLLRRGRPLRYGPRHYMSPQVPWVPFPFCCYTGVPFADAHSTACLTSVALKGSEFRSLRSPTSDLSRRVTGRSSNCRIHFTHPVRNGECRVWGGWSTLEFPHHTDVPSPHRRGR